MGYRLEHSGYVRVVGGLPIKLAWIFRSTYLLDEQILGSLTIKVGTMGCLFEAPALEVVADTVHPARREGWVRHESSAWEMVVVPGEELPQYISGGACPRRL